MTRCLARHSHASPCRDEVKGQDRVVVCSSHLHTHRPPRWKGHLFFLGGGGGEIITHILRQERWKKKLCYTSFSCKKNLSKESFFFFYFFFECDACNSVALRVARLLRIREYGNNKRASNFRSCLVPFFFLLSFIIVKKSIPPPCLFFFLNKKLSVSLSNAFNIPDFC